MIGRHRGEHDTRGIWHPRPPGHDNPPAGEAQSPPQTSADATAAARQAATAVVELASKAVSNVANERPHRWGPLRRLAFLVLCGGLGFLAAHYFAVAPQTTAARLPATPRRWVDAYEAAAIDNPPQVCRQLFSPQLAAAYASVGHHRSCINYFTHGRSTSLQVRGVLDQGETAVVKLHQTIEGTDWNVVLQRHDASWWAIDLIEGEPLR